MSEEVQEDPNAIVVAPPTPRSDKKCPTCTRDVWDGGHNPADDECTEQGDYSCKLVRNNNSLAAALKSVVKLIGKKIITQDDRQAIRTAMAIGEEIQPSPRSCPIATCGKSEVIRRTVVAPHYSQYTDTRLCPASFHVVLMGVMLEKAG